MRLLLESKVEKFDQSVQTSMKNQDIEAIILKKSENQDSYVIKAVRGRYKKLEQEMKFVQANLAKLKEENSKLYTENESNKLMAESKNTVIKDLELRIEVLRSTVKNLNVKLATLEEQLTKSEQTVTLAGIESEKNSSEFFRVLSNVSNKYFQAIEQLLKGVGNENVN